jgi:hypothetical protein
VSGISAREEARGEKLGRSKSAPPCIRTFAASFSRSCSCALYLLWDENVLLVVLLLLKLLGIDRGRWVLGRFVRIEGRHDPGVDGLGRRWEAGKVRVDGPNDPYYIIK